METFGLPEQPTPEERQPVQDAIQRERTTQPQSGSIKAGEVLASFSVLEGAPFSRSRRWMWSMLLLVLVLLAIAFGFDGMNSITMALAFAVLIGVYGLTMRRADPSRRIPLTFTTYGLQLAGRFYPYTRFRYFYLLEFPNYVMFTLQDNGRFTTGVEIYQLPTDTVEEVRGLLQDRVSENLGARETLIQRLVRVLQL